MASRYYPAVAAPNAIIHGGCAGTWARQSVFGRSWDPVQWTWRLTDSKTNAGTQITRQIRTNQQGNFDLLLARWMTPVLDGQTLGGTLQICFGVQAVWVPPGLPSTNDAAVRFKLHAYVANGQTAAVRTVLLDNVVDTVDFPGTSGQVWRSLSTAAALPTVGVTPGDVIVLEIGMRVVSSPTPTPQYFPDDTGQTVVNWIGTGANAALADAVAGDTTSLRAPWVEFSQTLVEAAAPAPPANDACADALVISDLPYDSGFIDTSQSADTDRAVWWTWTAPADGLVFFAALGSNYQAQIQAFTGSCGALSGFFVTAASTSLGAHRSLAYLAFEAVMGTQYWIRLRQVTTANQLNAPTRGGMARLTGFYQGAPAEDDVYLPAGSIAAIRNGAPVNLQNAFVGSAPTGVGIDYTRRPMDSFNGGVDTQERILVGLHNFELVEILDLATLNVGEFEVDFIGDPWFEPVVNTHPAQCVVTAAGELHQGWFGNGYLYIVGTGTLPAILNTISNNADYSALKSLSAIDGDNQPGAPFTATLRYPSVELTAPWAISLDETTGLLYYTSSGFYEPLGSPTNQIRVFNLSTGTQASPFATISLAGVNNPGLKGLQAIPGGAGLFVCNGTVVERRDASGALVRTYTPSIPEDSQSLCDVKISADGTAIWVIDEATTRLFKFDITTGVELGTWQPYLLPGTLVQMAIYQPNGFVPPTPPPPEGCPDVIDVVVPAPPPPVCPGPIVD